MGQFVSAHIMAQRKSHCWINLLNLMDTSKFRKLLQIHSGKFGSSVRRRICRKESLGRSRLFTVPTTLSTLPIQENKVDLWDQFDQLYCEDIFQSFLGAILKSLWPLVRMDQVILENIVDLFLHFAKPKSAKGMTLGEG